MGLIVHHLQVSQSERIVWLLEELKVPYKLVIHVRDPMLSPASLKNVPGNDTGKAPFLEDTDAAITLSESAAIAEYIINTYGNGQLTIKPGEKNYSDYLYWFHYSNGTLQPAMLVSMFMSASNAPEGNAMAGFAKQRFDECLKLLDARLASTKYLAGEAFTAADIMSVYSLTTQRLFGPQEDISAYENVLRWLKEVTARKAFVTAMAKADPLLKSWIEGPPPPSLGANGGVTSSVWKK